MMMRLLIALLAIAGLLASPVAVAAMPAMCDHAAESGMMADMDVSGTPDLASSSTHATGRDPCCDPTGHHKRTNQSCGQACAAMFGVVAALPASPTTMVLVSLSAEESLPRVVSTHPYEPTGPERPPKSIA